MTGKFLFAVALAAVAAPAGASVVVIGSSSARLCYEAAEAHLSLQGGGLKDCDAALAEDALGQDDRIATLVNRGILRMRSGATDAALADFDAAIVRDPREPEAYVNMGMALLRKGNGDAAVPMFRAALERHTRRPALAYYGRGVANEMKGQVKDAYLDYREASRLEPGWQDPQVELARFVVRRP